MTNAEKRKEAMRVPQYNRIVAPPPERRAPPLDNDAPQRPQEFPVDRPKIYRKGTVRITPEGEVNQAEQGQGPRARVLPPDPFPMEYREGDPEYEFDG